MAAVAVTVLGGEVVEMWKLFWRYLSELLRVGRFRDRPCSRLDKGCSGVGSTIPIRVLFRLVLGRR